MHLPLQHRQYTGVKLIRLMNDSVMLQNLEYLFNPRVVAVVGASANPDKLGFHVMKSLTSGGFKGTIVPVNPGTDSIMGIPAFSSLGDFPGAIDLAVIVLPAKMVPGIFQECRQKSSNYMTKA